MQPEKALCTQTSCFRRALFSDELIAAEWSGYLQNAGRETETDSGADRNGICRQGIFSRKKLRKIPCFYVLPLCEIRNDELEPAIRDDTRHRC